MREARRVWSPWGSKQKDPKGKRDFSNKYSNVDETTDRSVFRLAKRGIKKHSHVWRNKESYEEKSQLRGILQSPFGLNMATVFQIHEMFFGSLYKYLKPSKQQHPNLNPLDIDSFTRRLLSPKEITFQASLELPHARDSKPCRAQGIAGSSSEHPEIPWLAMSSSTIWFQKNNLPWDHIFCSVFCSFC